MEIEQNEINICSFILLSVFIGKLFRLVVGAIVSDEVTVGIVF